MDSGSSGGIEHYKQSIKLINCSNDFSGRIIIISYTS